MNPELWLALGAFVLAFAALALTLLHRAILSRMLGDRPAEAVVLASGPQTGPLPATNLPPPRRQLFIPPPMVGNFTLRDWLIHETQRDGVWAEVVAELYRRAAAVDWVADYFGPVLADPQRMAELQRHFTAMLVIATHTGVNQAMLDRLDERHRNVTNSAGTPITGQVFDAVVSTLAGVLYDSNVPDSAVAQLAITCAPFRPVLVRA